jgi:K+-transporting ATPase KdpF subunit
MCVFANAYIEEENMSPINLIMLAVCFLLLIYLAYALLRPERF